ncbi:hypothetical protein [Rhodanobacter sp. A1T4]|uniref:hypothetical protein n=1 Tax=Rhodanobacter sp. A1T4 TaxID=2723087 RepID=UPI0017BC535D|nr:hypothetical protein [Rhodanobacter sp. A1T4]MBB6249461.1 hypothetical protein [Rhodanobacter sp. A1T4]
MSKLNVVSAAIMAASMFSFCSVGFSQGYTHDNIEAQARQSWRNTVMHASPPNKTGCFHISYPQTEWAQVGCTAAPNRPFAKWPKSSSNFLGAAAFAKFQAQTVGDGTDYVAEVPGLLTYSVGDFPTVSGVTSETGSLGANDYSLQLNSNFMSTAACNGHSGCLAWQQFIYSSGEQAVFMQYWLIDYGTCPSGWNTDGDSCYKNSAAVSVPKIAISELNQLSIWANAIPGGVDQVGLGTGDDYITSGVDFYAIREPDSVVDLSSDWKESEFNIFGDGGGSAATFNQGSSITVFNQLGEQGSVYYAPTCVQNAGTTGETNNLTLGSCSTLAGSPSSNPSMTFTESN